MLNLEGDALFFCEQEGDVLVHGPPEIFSLRAIQKIACFYWVMHGSTTPCPLCDRGNETSQHVYLKAIFFNYKYNIDLNNTHAQSSLPNPISMSLSDEPADLEIHKSHHRRFGVDGDVAYH